MPAPRRQAHNSVTSELNSLVGVRRANNRVAVGRYYNSADLLLRQADFYRLKHNDAQLYVFLMRFASLVLETLPQHQDFRQEDAKYKRLRKRLAADFMPELEQIKLRLNLPASELPVHTRYQHGARPAEAVQTSLTNLPGLDWAQLTQPSYSAYPDAMAPGFGSSPAGYGQPTAPPLPGYASQSAGMDLLSSSSNGQWQPKGGQQQQQQQQRNLLPFDPQGDSSSLPAASSEALQRHALVPMAEQRRAPSQPPPPQAQRPLYPSFDDSPLRPIDFGYTPASQAAVASAAPAQLLPTNGAATGASLMDAAPMEARQRAPDPPLQLTADLQQQVASDVKPQLDLQLGPQEMPVDMVSPSAGDPCCSPGAAPQPAKSPLEKDFEGVRDVNVSVSLMEDFMRLCISNTQRNIETIGLLGGTLSSDGTSFNINTLIIPKQKGETDRVEMLKEEEIWDIFFQDGQSATQSLFPVGWIHTHPAFDCFLSSVDIHNQYGYQVMLEEAVAIVMSPRDSQNRKCGIFRLTTPGGMSLIKDCSKTGFHTHPPTSTGQKIYELCGHVYINPRVRHKVIDLRE